MEPEPERSERWRGRTREPEAANQPLSQTQRMLATELEALQQVATQLITARGMEALYEQTLDAGLTILGADFASIQMFYPEPGTKGKLKLLGHRGVSTQLAERWEWVDQNSPTTCGEALRTGRRVVVPDIRKCDFIAESENLKAFLDAGIYASYTLPLVSRSGALLGMVSTYWREPHELSVSELRALDVLGRLAADLIERTRADDAIWEHQQTLVSIYDTVQDVIFRLAVEPEERFRFVSVNAAFLRVTGLSQEAVVGKTVNEVIPEPSLTTVLGKYRQAIEQHMTVQWEETSNYPSGQLTGEVSITPVFDATGKCTHLVGSVHDVTERRRVEREAFARQKLETVGTLANGIAHDFNNILGGILAQAELALSELDSGSVPAEELAAIRDAAMRGAQIVRELLAYAGTQSPALVPLDLSQIVEEILGLLKVSISKQARIETDLAKNLPAIGANPGQISQLLMNLVTNASDAIGDRNGMIRIVTRRVTAGVGTPERGPLNGRHLVQLEVSDTGCGMRRETQARVFEPFFSTKSMGRGIGLAVVDGIVRSLGGAIQLESEPGKGTTIRISLPATEMDSKAIETAGSEAPEEPLPSRVNTVLLVEDETPLRQAVSKMLSRMGASVIEAADGRTALEAIRTEENRIDLVVLDITIPGTPSREILAQAIRLRPDVRVIVTSAYSQDVAAASLQSSVFHFLQKPYRLTDLAKLIRAVG